MTKIKSYLKLAFPKSEHKWRTIIFISLFVTCFMFVFQPFGLRMIDNITVSLIIIGGYGLVTFCILIINLILIEKAFPKFFNEKNWLLWKEVFWLFIVISSIGVGNLLYNQSFNSQLELTLANLIKFQLITFAVALFPIFFLVITKQKYLSNKHSAIAYDMNKSINNEDMDNLKIDNLKIIFYSYNEKKNIVFYSNDFYFLESKGNYIEIYYISNKNLECVTIRNTLKNSLTYFILCPNIIQCHRAYIVNVKKVISAEGNSQGLKLKFDDCDMEIPVSKSYVSTIQNIL